MSRKEDVFRFFNENNGQWEKQADANIEKYRKNDAVISLVGDADLLKNAAVKIRQVNHKFKFGANIFMLDELETSEKNKIYRKKFAKLFNLATIPFYWSDLEPEKGKPRYAKNSPKVYRRPSPDLCIEYCKEHNIEPKCHCLNYDDFLPKWLEGASVEEIKLEYEKRFAEIAKRYADVIPSFEVTNETLKRRDNGSAFFSEDDFVDWSYKTADKYFPNNRLIINDFNIWAPEVYNNRTFYYMQIERLLNSGNIHLDSVGMQFHGFFTRKVEVEAAERFYNPVILNKLMDCYSALGLKEQITEMTIPAFSNDIEDEAVQAVLLCNLYKVFFSHPSMEAIIYWNLVDGYAAWAEPGDMESGENAYYGGFLRFDMSEKPAYKALYNLIHKEWHTELNAKPQNGKLSFRGFLGDYEADIIIGKTKKTVCFNIDEGKNNFEIKL
ncbi:MAG: endo-1,4-beta-xylanase [Clostridiales bacterium]|nr:endo-1,4-beta-xylanase [Candidatus Equinaster intestinalis]